MARITRVIAPGIPHHITQRGNHRQQTFFCDDDYRAYIDLMAEWCSNYRVEIWAWCLMPNHVHVIAVPETAEGLARAIGEANRRYTRRINFREKWRGHLWQ
jgi:putative transposase